MSLQGSWMFLLRKLTLFTFPFFLGGGGISYSGKLSLVWKKVTFNLEKLIIFVHSIKRIRTRTCLGLTPETTICNSLTAKVKCIKWFAICASLKLTDLISSISICRNVQDHKLDWDKVDTFFYGLFLNYALLKKRALVIVKTVWSTWKRILFFHNMRVKLSIAGER